MENPSTHQAENPTVTAEATYAITAQVATYTGVQAYTVATTNPRTKWVKSAITLSRHRQKHGQFSAYQLGEARKPYTAPVYLTVCDPEPPLLRPKCRQPPSPSPMLLAAKAWYRDWLKRDWDAANEFFKATDPDEEPTHPIIQPDYS